jgi:hypothetical protein
MLVTSVISSADNTHVFYEGIADCRLQIVISVPSSVYFLFLVSHLMSNIFRVCSCFSLCAGRWLLLHVAVTDPSF